MAMHPEKMEVSFPFQSEYIGEIEAVRIPVISPLRPRAPTVMYFYESGKRWRVDLTIKEGSHSSSNPNHSKNLKTPLVIGVASGGVVYGLAKWKEEEVRRRLRIAPEYLGILAGAAGLGVSYYLL